MEQERERSQREDVGVSDRLDILWEAGKHQHPVYHEVRAYKEKDVSDYDAAVLAVYRSTPLVKALPTAYEAGSGTSLAPQDIGEDLSLERRVVAIAQTTANVAAVAAWGAGHIQAARAARLAARSAGSSSISREVAALRRIRANNITPQARAFSSRIMQRGIDSAIRVNGYRAVSHTRLAGTSTPQDFGIKAHQRFVRFNNRLANRYAGTYRISTEQFRSPIGRVVAPRSPESIGADVLYTPWRSNAAPIIYDLKTYSTIPRPISAARQYEFFQRFSAIAREIYVSQWP